MKRRFAEMATPGQLVEAVAEALVVPVETVTNYDRVLSENGMRSKSGRGRGAAKVTAGDAANLLIAIMGSPIAGASVKEAANTCRKYAYLPSLKPSLGTNNFSSFGLRMLDELPSKHTLHEGVSALIESAAKGEHFRISGLARGSEKTVDSFCGIDLAGPRPWAEIIADEFGEGKKFARLVYTRPWKKSRHQDEGDLHQHRYMTYRTIRKLGSLLSEQCPA